MNVIIVAVCVNIAIVNANNDIDLDTIIRIIKGRRFSTPGDAHESVEAMHIIPGFYLETPKTISKSIFRYPKTKHSDVYGRFNMVDTNRQDEKKTRDSNTNSRNDHLTAKILKSVKSLDRFRAKKKYEQAKERSPKSDDKFQVEQLLANFILGERNKNDFRGYGKGDKSGESNPIIGSKTAEKSLVEKLLANVLNGINTNNAIADGEIYKYGTTDENIWSSGPRYGNILQQILEAAQNSNQGKAKRSSLVVVETKPSLLLRAHQKSTEDILNDKDTSSLNTNLADEIENNANEILDEFVEDEEESEDTHHGSHHHTRRKGDKKCKSDDDLSGTTKEGSESDQEKNPGNPFTVHKNKYKQNWPWNHYMDGDHMNINPFGPQFASLGPSGPELFFGRKWWYFNQDDYKPMG